LTGLLDTHILVAWADGAHEDLSKAQRKVLDAARPDAPLLVSEISLWEIATLVSLGRLEFSRPLRDWLEAATAPPLVRTVGISPAVAAEVALFPDSFHRDPADRVLVATARVFGASLLTRDRKILASGLCPVLG
jgi:PIN domain nuclease of toxin-antitoxin system